MEIRFSRHANRRIDLYKIDKDDVKETIKSAIMDRELLSGKHEEVNYDLRIKYGYPLKVVFAIEDNCVEVITTYPLKKERSR
ncbi:MAG: DUF4258 domain-containing protein [Thermodesulfovibrionales bacterium]